jgi:hypothetical protein
MGKDAKGGKKGSITASPDKLVKTGKKGEIELTEGELKAVSGGIKYQAEKWIT